MPPTLLTASSTPWPAILVGVAVVVAVCLWLLFRSGSMADRARSDHPEDDVTTATTDSADAPVTDATGDGTDGPAQPADGGR